MARPDQRFDDARPVEDLLPGRDRRGLRAGRLLAIQRALRSRDPGRAAAVSAPGIWNRFDHRPLEGFVLAITPFNFTSIAANLPTAPALMGVPVVWKPSPTQGLFGPPDDAAARSRGPAAGRDQPRHRRRGRGERRAPWSIPIWPASTSPARRATFRHLWQTVGEHLTGYRSYPRLVGETGGKDFVIAHPSADVDALAGRPDARGVRVPGPEVLGGVAGLHRASRCGAGCATTWSRMSASLPMGDATDFSNFLGAVIDRRAFDRLSGVLDRARATMPLSGRGRRHAPTTAWATSSRRPSSPAAIPPTRSSRPSTSARSSASTSTTTVTSMPSCRSGRRRQRRTR